MHSEMVSKSLFVQLFFKSHGHQSLCFIHVKKPDHPYFQHTKYDPDISSHTGKRGVSKLLWTSNHPVVRGLVFQARPGPTG